MARYSDGSGITDPAIVVTEDHLLKADTEVDLVLAGKGINPGDLSLPIPSLALLADAYAAMKASRDGAIGENSPLLAKAQSYEREADRLAQGITAASLGIDTSSTGGFVGLASVGFERG